MGAYENPRFFNAPNYMAGTQAFIGTFQKGLQEGLQYGEDLIADRKEYEKGIYEKGDELKKELDAAVANSQMTKQQVQGALRQFYDEALAIDVPTKKGLGGLFVKAQEKRLGDLDLQEAQQSFTDAVTGINTAFNYTYDPEVDIMENEDRGHEYYKKKRAIYEAIKSGNAKTDFSYAKGQGFNSNIKVMIDGEEKEFTTAEIQTIFSASGKEQRDIIDAKHTDTVDGLYKRVEAEVANDYEAIKLGDKNALIRAETRADKTTDQVLGLTRDASGKILFNKKNIDFINDEYNNHADISLENKINIFKNNKAFANLKEQELLDIIDEPMTMGVEAYKTRFNLEEKEARDFYNNVLNAKAEIVKESYMEELRDRGLLDKGYKAPKATDTSTEGDKGRNFLTDYAKIRTNTIADTTSASMNKPDPTEYLQGGDQFSVPAGTTLGPDIRFFENPNFDPNKPSGPDNPQSIQGLAMNEEFKEDFLGSVVKIGSKGELRRVQNAFIDPEGKIVFDYEGGTVTDTVDGEKVLEAVDFETTPYSIYNPKSMKSLYKAMLPDVKSEGSGVFTDVIYAGLVAESYLDRPEQFAAPEMNKWANYIVKNYGTKNIQKNAEFMQWLKNNSKSLPKGSAFKNIPIIY